jgi:hypothetical protein
MVVGRPYSITFMMLKDNLIKRNFDKSSDRLEPDFPFTHWRLYFKSLMLSLCKKSLNIFSILLSLDLELMQ